MISFIICSINPELAKACTESITRTITTPHEIILVDNREKNEGLAKVYNTTARKAKYDHLIFVHEDVEFLTPGWDKKILALLNNKTVGLVGVAGTNYLFDIGSWATAGQPFIKGHVVMPAAHNPHEYQIDKFCEEEGDFPVVAVDGVFLATKKEVVTRIPFDEQTFDTFHFYDIDFSLRVAHHYTVLVTTSTLILHKSPGNFRKDWNTYHERFKEKHYGTLPYTNQTTKPDLYHLKTWKAYPYTQKDQAHNTFK